MVVLVRCHYNGGAGDGATGVITSPPVGRCRRCNPGINDFVSSIVALWANSSLFSKLSMTMNSCAAKFTLDELLLLLYTELNNYYYFILVLLVVGGNYYCALWHVTWASQALNYLICVECLIWCFSLDEVVIHDMLLVVLLFLMKMNWMRYWETKSIYLSACLYELELRLDMVVIVCCFLTYYWSVNKIPLLLFAAG
jgi:hypothetical protein